MKYIAIDHIVYKVPNSMATHIEKLIQNRNEAETLDAQMNAELIFESYIEAVEKNYTPKLVLELSLRA